MFRLHAHLLTLLCIVVAVVCLLPETSTSQATRHSLSVNGTSSYVSVPNSSTINISGPITVEAWIKLNAVTANYQDIVCREAWGQVGSGGGYEFSITNSGKVRLDLFQSHNTYTPVIGATTVSANAWHHVAGVFDGSQMRVYLDGVLDGSLSTTSGPASGTSSLTIGKSSYTTYYFGGLIDEVRLSAAALYSSNFTPGLGPGSNTRALWKFDGQTANDFSGNGNHGTLQGSATYSTDVPATTNNAPTVSLNDPLSNSNFTAGATVVIDASAADSDGVVSKVDFYQGTTLLGTDTTSPYTIAWTNVPAGVYSLTAKATDDSGAVTVSSAVAVNVNSLSVHSLSLNGTSSYVSVPNSSTINISGPITVEAWIKLNAVTANYQDIVCREAWGQVGSGGGYEFSITNNGKVRLDLFQSHNTYTPVIGATTVSANAWHHVAGVFDGSQMRVYLDGVLDGSLSTTNGPASGTSSLTIGKSSYTTYYFGGLIDEVRLSAAALYSSNFTPGLGPGSNTRALWKFDGQTANDFSGNGNHGTLQGGATYSTSVPPASGGGSQLPVAVANGPYSAQLGQSVSFSSSGSLDPDGTIAAYHWNFGDGTSANTASPSHSYAASGLFTATLTVTDNSGLRSSAVAAVSITGASQSRVDPMNQTGGAGENPLSRNFNWSLPLVNLPGRGGMDLGLALAYNSLVWTKNSGSISFDDDHGFPSPGFRLGFPVIQSPYFNTETGKNTYLLIGPDGSRTELRQIGASALYESADSSHLLLDTTTMILRGTDGTQLSYAWLGAEYNCTQIKDRNGNYITVNYTPAGRIDTVIDTLARSIKFNYDASGSLTSITQVWNQGAVNEVTHSWATFTYSNTTIQTDFNGLTVYGPASIKTLASVTLADGSHSDFTYTNWGQVWKISGYAPDNHLLGYRSYNLPGSDLSGSTQQTDCPRFTERHDWAQYWNGDTDGAPASNEEAVTAFAEPVSDSWTMPSGGTALNGTRAQVTAPDGTSNKIYFIGTAGTDGWRRGLPALVNTYDSANVLQRQAMTTWTQDNIGVSYPLNPRVSETNIYDPAGNHARSETTYQQFTFTNGTSCYLPIDVYEYAANGTKLRSMRTDYNTSATYTDRRIIGLVSERRLYEGDVNANGALLSKVGFFYDESSSIQGTDAPVQHDNTNYSATFVTGRGNISTVKRYDVTNVAQFTTNTTKYNTAGAVVLSKDGLDHPVSVSYTDAFSDDVSRNTLAYPTKVTDPDNYYSTAQYNFDFGAVTRTKTPPPNVTGTQNPLDGPEQTVTFDAIGRLQQTTNLVNGAYTRYEYPTSANRLDTFMTIQDGLGEAHSFQVTDGAGRVIATATDHNLSTLTFRGQKTVYDVMGRVIKTSNLTETTASGPPSQWNTTGDDSSTGWIYTQQTYDWKGRPKLTTNQDNTTRTTEYSGCGCAGGELVTLTDEGTNIGTSGNPIIKKRQQKIYHDVLGRVTKTEVMNWDGSGLNGTGPNNTVYAATVSTYNARDQVTQIRQYSGAEGSATYQDTTMEYDGFGRLKARHTPEQAANKSTTWIYNADDTVQSITDARGAATNFTYNNNRRLVSNISWSVPAPSPTPIPTPAAVSFTYDAVGNRTSMTDGFGSVNYEYYATTRLKSETRTLTGVTNPNSVDGKFKLSYDYNLAGQLKKFTDAANMTIDYGYDSTGRVIGVTGSDTLYANVSTYASNFQYRAWGGLKSMTDGKGNTRFLTYNSRALPTHFEVSGNIVSQNFDYHDDGALSFVHNQLDNNFDRSYRYDHASRLIEGKTGGTARNGTGDTPFYESFGYDAFNNLTARQTNTWNDQTMASDASSYLNNRRLGSGWSYDEDGRNLTILSRSNQYDASGRQVQMNAHYVVLGHNFNITRNYGYDGAGSRISESVSTATTYYLSSSVLGAVVEELDGSGQKTTGYVYSPGGELLATQTSGSPTNVVTWKHLTSFGEYTINTGNSTVGRVEFDPLHAEVSLTAPSAAPFIETQGEISPSHLGDNLASRFGDIFNTTAGCMINGIESTCDMAMRMRNSGAGDQVMKALVYNRVTRGVDWIGDIHEDGVAGFAFLEFRSAVGLQGGGNGPDTYSEVLAGTESSSVTIYGGATLASTTIGFEPNSIPPPDRLPGSDQTACRVMADVADDTTRDVGSDPQQALLNFDYEFSRLYHGGPIRSIADARRFAPGDLRQINPYYASNGSGFKEQYRDTGTEPFPIGGRNAEQTHHFSAYLSMGINGRMDIYLAGQYGIRPSLSLPQPDNAGDQRLGQAAFEYGLYLRRHPKDLKNIRKWIRNNICTSQGQGLYRGGHEN